TCQVFVSDCDFSWRRDIPVKLTAIVIALGLSTAAHAAGRIERPNVPTDIEVDASFKPFFSGHAAGTQNYICEVVGGVFDWLPIGPQAPLFDEDLGQVATHFQSRNPWQSDAIQATWQHSQDTSAVWAVRVSGSTDSAYVAPGAIEWLKLQVMGAQ